jgi:subtilisin-like proprotein convertase family protein
MKNKVTGYLGIKLGLLAMIALFVSSSGMPTAKASSAERTKTDKTRVESASPETVFTNATPIIINDEDNATPYPSDITVSGMGGTITSVKVTLNGFTHSFPDDVGILLKGPTGAALLLQDGAGDDPDMDNITFRLIDGATALPNLTAWAAGDWKPTAYFTGDPFPAPGPGTTYSHPGPAGGNTATFASVFNGTAPNGVWSLYVIDFVAGDDGAINGGWSIDITTNGPAANEQHVLDYDGDGATDYTVVRNTGGGSGGAVTWFVDPAGAGPNVITPWGISTDFFVDGDFDGDNKSDITVFRPGATQVAAFYILQSQTSTLRVEQFGQTGDDPTIIGDYNDDGKDDVAVYRGGASAGLPSFWYYRTAAGGPVFTTQWGQNGDFPAPGDYDGDGMADFSVQRNNGAGNGVFLTHYGVAATGVISQTLTWGTSSDLILPGDYDGDGKTDYAVARGSGGQIIWSVKMSGGGPDIFGVAWGLSASDFPTQGDYDDDGKTDIAVWRPNADTSQNFFLVRKSSDSTLQYSEWGAQGDYPVANYNSH